MQITQRSPLTGKYNTMDLDVTQGQLNAWRDNRTAVQQAFPHLNKAEREFLITGYTQEDWDTIFSGENE